jgi:hypothetical protein
VQLRRGAWTSSFGSGQYGADARGKDPRDVDVSVEATGAPMSAAGPVLRVATEDDVDAITAVMRASVLELFPQFYDEQQTASAALFVAHPDPL